jgi:ribonuclease J
MVNVVSVAIDQGYLNVPEGMIIEAHEIGGMDPERVAILCTGSQGEPMAALSRLSSSNYRHASILPEDTVIFASTPIPGNERNVSKVIDNLYLLGAKVIYGSGSATGMHVSGHAQQEELKLMLTLMRPKYFIPIHGEYRMLHQHRQLAESVGIERENIFIINNGDVVDVNNSLARQTRKIPSGNIFVDGLGIGDVGNMVLRDRKLLSEDGMIVIVITLSKSDGEIITGPDTISRGFVYARDSEELMNEINLLVITTVNTTRSSSGNQRSVLKQSVKATLGKFLYTKTKKRPMILPIIIEV